MSWMVWPAAGVSPQGGMTPLFSTLANRVTLPLAVVMVPWLRTSPAMAPGAPKVSL